MCFDDGTRYRQPEADAFLFCCEERVEKSGHEISGNTSARIAHGNLHCVPLVAGIDGQQSWVKSWLVHGIHRIDDQIQDHLLQTSLVGLNQRQRICKF